MGIVDCLNAESANCLRNIDLRVETSQNLNLVQKTTSIAKRLAMSGGPRLRQKNAVAGSSSEPHYDQEDDHISTLYGSPVCSLKSMSVMR